MQDGCFGDFQLPLQMEQKTIHTCNKHASRTDKQHQSRPQTTTIKHQVWIHNKRVQSTARTCSGHSVDCAWISSGNCNGPPQQSPRHKTKQHRTHNRALTLMRRSGPRRKRRDRVLYAIHYSASTADSTEAVMIGDVRVTISARCDQCCALTMSGRVSSDSSQTYTTGKGSTRYD